MRHHCKTSIVIIIDRFAVVCILFLQSVFVLSRVGMLDNSSVSIIHRALTCTAGLF